MYSIYIYIILYTFNIQDIILYKRGLIKRPISRIRAAKAARIRDGNNDNKTLKRTESRQVPSAQPQEVAREHHKQGQRRRGV